MDVELFTSAEAAIAARRLAAATGRLREGTVSAMMDADDAFMAYRKLVLRDLEPEETQLPSWRDAVVRSETSIYGSDLVVYDGSSCHHLKCTAHFFHTVVDPRILPRRPYAPARFG